MKYEYVHFRPPPPKKKENNANVEKRNSRLFYNSITTPQTLFSVNVHIVKALLCANNVQHIERLSHTAYQVHKLNKAHLF